MQKLLRSILSVLFLAAVFNSCAQKEMLFAVLSPQRTGINFNNHLSESDASNILDYLYYYNGGGVAVADFNADGLEDIFFTGNETSCRLYLNLGNLTFRDITESAGLSTSCWATGVCIADINLDGFKDIYVSVAGHSGGINRANKLFIHKGLNSKSGMPHFEEMAESYGLADTGFTTQSVFFDMDQDEDLDLFVMNHANNPEKVNTPSGLINDGSSDSQDHLYRNDGNNHFTETSIQSGIKAEGYGLGVAIGDFNADHLPDIFVANDFIYPDNLYINQGNGVFLDEAKFYFPIQSYNSMGCDLADIDNDQSPDLMVLDMLPPEQAKFRQMAGGMTWYKWDLMIAKSYAPQFMRNTLFKNNGLQKAESPGYHFSEIARFAGVEATNWSWSPLFADFNNDGWKDLYITNGYLRDITDRDFVEFSSNLGMFNEKEKANQDLIEEIRKHKDAAAVNALFINNHKLGFGINAVQGAKSNCSNGMAYADLDQDGDLDLILNNINAPASILENNSPQKQSNYLAIVLEGPTSNPTGIGAEVSIQVGDNIQQICQYPVRGYQSQVSEMIHFGLGNAEKVDKVIVHWPNGKESRLQYVQGNQKIKISYSAALNPVEEKPDPAHQSLFADVTDSFGHVFTHQFLDYRDFNQDPLLPRSFAQCGPVLEAGDLNQDGLDDLFASGNSGKSGTIAFQTQAGNFKITELPKHIGQVNDALIFDYDCDGWNDLYLIRGGDQIRSLESEAYASSILINDKKGGFTPLSSESFTPFESKSCISASAPDRHGDQYIFIGGNVLSGQYPKSNESAIYRKTCGKLQKLNTIESGGIETSGLVCAAEWADIDGDSKSDLVIAAEWSEPRLFINKGDHFVLQNLKSNLPLSGWWRAITCLDVDSDGDVDILLGNEGLNSRFNPTSEQPLELFFGDFDKNGFTDPILCAWDAGRQFPVFPRDPVARQIPSLRFHYPKNEPFVNRDITQIFPKEQWQNTASLTADQFASICLLNDGNGHFKAQMLPYHCQFSPVNQILTYQLQGNKNPSIICWGNSISAEMTTGYQLGFNPEVLTLSADKNFKSLSSNKSGLLVSGVVKKTVLLKRSGKPDLIIAGQENGPLHFFILQHGLEKQPCSDHANLSPL